MTVLVSTRGLTRRSVQPAVVRERAEHMLAALKLNDSELSILLCSDSVIHELNRDFRGYDKPTDVLAFPLAEGIEMPPTLLLGDVAISLETARKQAEERGWAIVEEVTFLLAHGLLHLLGFDHRDRNEERRMMALTDGLRATIRGNRRCG